MRIDGRIVVVVLRQVVDGIAGYGIHQCTVGSCQLLLLLNLIEHLATDVPTLLCCRGHSDNKGSKEKHFFHGDSLYIIIYSAKLMFYFAQDKKSDK